MRTSRCSLPPRPAEQAPRRLSHASNPRNKHHLGCSNESRSLNPTLKPWALVSAPDFLTHFVPCCKKRIKPTNLKRAGSPRHYGAALALGSHLLHHRAPGLGQLTWPLIHVWVTEYLSHSNWDSSTFFWSYLKDHFLCSLWFVAL